MAAGFWDLRALLLWRSSKPVVTLPTFDAISKTIGLNSTELTSGLETTTLTNGLNTITMTSGPED